MKRAVAAAIVLLFVVGCNSLPIGWGGKYKLIAATDTQLIYEYDAYTSSFEDVLAAASDYAQSHGKNAVFLKEGPPRMLDQIKTVIFELQNIKKPDEK